ncbi:hypothetical protein WA171_000593 [Blastocystis sp. BT1]
MSNAKYFTVYLIWMVFGLIIEYLPSGNSIIDSNLRRYFGTAGIEIVYRLSCALVCSYGILFFCTLFWPATHHMVLGVFVVILIFFTWLFVWGVNSVDWLYGYRGVARILSAFYLVLQSLSLVDFAFTLHDVLTQKMEDTNKRYKYTDKTCCCANQWTSMYLTLSFVFSIGSVIACIAFYFMFRVDGHLCGQNALVITLTLIMGLFCCFICLHSTFNRGFLPPATFFAIILFYLVTSLLTNPSDKCNPYKSSSNYWVTVLNVLFVITSGYWMAYRIRNPKVDEPDTDTKDPEKAEKLADIIPDDDSHQWCVFNACMVLAGFYLSMLCSAWYTGSVTERPTAVFNFTSPLTFWLYNISIWVAFIVFIYAAIAPAINQDRTY